MDKHEEEEKDDIEEEEKDDIEEVNTGRGINRKVDDGKGDVEKKSPGLKRLLKLLGGQGIKKERADEESASVSNVGEQGKGGGPRGGRKKG